MKKTLKTIISAVLLLCIILTPAYAAHVHTLEFVRAKDATCTEQGNIHHYKCSGCGALFYDCQGKKPADAKDVYTDASGHEYSNWQTVREVTDTEEGLKVRYCIRENTPAPLIITLDAGHGPHDNKGYYSGFYEGKNNFELMTYLYEYLNEYSGVEVYTTRRTVNDAPELSSRGKTAADNGSEVFISIHSDAVDSTNAYGVTVLRSFLRPESEELARLLGQAIVDTMKPDTEITYFRLKGPITKTEKAQSADLGDGTTQDWYAVIRDSVVSEKCRYSFILEHGFHSNPTECAWLMNSENLKAAAKAEAEVLAAYFGLVKKENAVSYTCNHKEEKVLPKTGDHTHALEFVHEKAATCTEQGWRHHYECTVCGKLFYDCQGKKPADKNDVYIDALGHDYGEWEIIKPATATETGLKVRYCKRDNSPAPLIVTLDAGHGHNDNHGYFSTFFEGDNNFEILTYLTEYLNEYDGIEVYSTKKTVNDKPKNELRAQVAVDNGSEVFISLHSNSGTDKSACGVSVFRSFLRPESVELAALLGQAIVDTMKPDTEITYFRKGGPIIYTEPAYNEDVGDGITQDYYNVIRNTVVSEKCRYSIILEHGFHSNKTECTWLMNSDNLRKVTKAEAEVIANYFGLHKKGAVNTVYEPCKEEAVIPCTVKIPGDANGDGKVNNKDVVCIFRYVSGDPIDGLAVDNCDANQDGRINNKDIAVTFKLISE